MFSIIKKKTKLTILINVIHLEFQGFVHMAKRLVATLFSRLKFCYMYN